MHKENTVNTHWTCSGALSHIETFNKIGVDAWNCMVNSPGRLGGSVTQSTCASFPNCGGSWSCTLMSSNCSVLRGSFPVSKDLLSEERTEQVLNGSVSLEPSENIF